MNGNEISDRGGSKIKSVRSKRSLKLLVFLIFVIVVLIIIILVVKKCLNQRNKNHSSTSESSKSSFLTKNPRDILNSWRRLTKTPAPNAIEVFTQPGYLIAFDQELESKRKEIFPFHITEFVSNDKDANNYNKLHQEFKSPKSTWSEAKRAIRAKTTDEEISLLVKWKQFLDHPNINSMAYPVDIERVYVSMLQIAANKIPGDLVEIGAWKGGIGMWMKAVSNYMTIKGLDTELRKIWLFDAFGEFPSPTHVRLPDGNKISPSNLDLDVHSLTQVMYENQPDVIKIRDKFSELGLLDSNVKLVKGLFTKTLQASLNSNNVDPLSQISLLRIDSDYYDSVLYVLETLYPYMAKGGIIIIDDYHNPSVGCRTAVDEFRSNYDIQSPLINNDSGPVHWTV